MSIMTPRPTIIIPNSSFPEYDSSVMVSDIILNESLILHEIIGLGSQGIVYSATMKISDKDTKTYGVCTNNYRLDLLQKQMFNRNFFYESKEVHNKTSINVAVKKINGYASVKIHRIASRLTIAPEVYNVIYEKSKYPKTYICMEKMWQTIKPSMYTTYYTDVIAEMVTILFENNIFHNDLRDTNLMLCLNGNIKIIDFESAILTVSEDGKPLISKFDYDRYMMKNYYIYLKGVKTSIKFTNSMIFRHIKCIEKFNKLLLDNFMKEF